MHYYEKSLLLCYNTLESIVEQMEGLMLTKALASYSSRESCERQAEKIILLIENKKRLEELKLKLDKIFSRFTEEEMQLLGFKYFNVLPKDKDFDHTSRTYFRRQQRVLLKFGIMLEKNGMTEEWFTEKYLGIAFIKSVFLRLKNEECSKLFKEKEKFA